MPVYKDENRNTWYVKFQLTGHDGIKHYVTKRGFRTKREAASWEEAEKAKYLENSGMLFKDLAEVYKSEHLTRLRRSTAAVKINMIDKHITPYFAQMPLNSITERTIVDWQNELLGKVVNGKPYSKSFLYTVHSMLNSILNYAVKNYDLEENPVGKAGSIGSLKRNGDDYWTQEEYERFIAEFAPGTDLFLAFEILYWCGIREGELLALTPDDFFFEDDVIDINKTYHVINGEEYITPPKSKEGCRRVKLPHSLSEELEQYIREKNIEEKERIFPFTRHVLETNIAKKAKALGMPKITVHDLRHAHVSLLIAMKYNPVAISARMGHKSAYITLRYAHALKDVQDRMADALEKCF